MHLVGPFVHGMEHLHHMRSCKNCTTEDREAWLRLGARKGRRQLHEAQQPCVGGVPCSDQARSIARRPNGILRIGPDRAVIHLKNEVGVGQLGVEHNRPARPFTCHSIYHPMLLALCAPPCALLPAMLCTSPPLCPPCGAGQDLLHPAPVRGAPGVQLSGHEPEQVCVWGGEGAQAGAHESRGCGCRIATHARACTHTHTRMHTCTHAGLGQAWCLQTLLTAACASWTSRLTR